jgi:branched-chain amino acid transport system ATP-binding protein
MLAIGRALMAAPQVLLADELSLGLAPIIVKQVFAKLEEVRKTGITVLVVEQNARLAMKVADYLYVLKYGRVVMEGPRAEFEHSTALVDAYLGV